MNRTGSNSLVELQEIYSCRPIIRDYIQSLLDTHHDRRLIITGNGWSNGRFQEMANYQGSPGLREINVRRSICDIIPESKGIFQKSEI